MIGILSALAVAVVGGLFVRWIAVECDAEDIAIRIYQLLHAMGVM